MRTHTKPAIIVHGGATTISETDAKAYKSGCFKAVQAGWGVLNEGGTALQAVEAAVRILEADDTFNAGYGSVLNRVGAVEMDAAIMDGSTLNAGAVGALQGVRYPIEVARLVLESDTVFLVGKGAHCFAESQGAALCEPQAMISPKQHRKWIESQKWTKESDAANHKAGCDTVGCVALDINGHLAAGTSTGGLAQKMPGRIGDAPLVGSGLYADNDLGACSLTGDGEKILRMVMAKTALDLLRNNLCPHQAAQRALEMMSKRVSGEAGCIILDTTGRIGWGHTAPNMACAYFVQGMEAPLAFVHKSEETERMEPNSHGTEK